ncbi:MAG TPA: alanine dehydrogenase [Usitatibacter sp.]|jgi:alanine dehydrogenase|nr:alanine dehydrogenase [Usitatibacter sp.]
MIVGVPRETKEGERRVALLPLAVEEIAGEGHDVRVETRAGINVGFDDQAYRDAGADIVVARDVWDSDLIVKVKEVQPADLAVMPRGASIFSFHHLPREPERTRALAAKGVTAIAFEMVQDARGEYPLLAPMSRIAGRMAAERFPAHKVLVLGRGHAGSAAAEAARKRGAEVVVLSRADATPENIERHALDADLVVGAVFVAGAPTPKLLPRTLVRRMKPGAVIADISIDAGGVAETSRPTTHAEPTYVEEGVVHYCVTNIPAADPAAAAAAICAAALPYVLDLVAHESIATTLMKHRELRGAVLLWQGRVNHEAIAAEAGLPYSPLTDADLAEAA